MTSSSPTNSAPSSVDQTAKTVAKFLQDHSNTIFTTAGVVGSVATAYLTGRASFKAAEYIRAMEDEHGFATDPRVRLQIRARMVWRMYIPAAGAGAVTVTSIMLAHHIGNRRTAALAAAYAIADRGFSEYKTKVLQKIGPKKEQTIRDDLAKDRVDRKPFDELTIIGAGSVICFDQYTGRYFMSDMETIRSAVNDINYEITHNNYASLTDFYNLIGLSRTSVSDDMGWNADRMLELEFSTVMSEGGKPCIAIDYRLEPIRGFSRLQ